MSAGIYVIKNILSGKKYIGRASDFKARFKGHLHLLRDNRHYNKELQKDFNKDKEVSFEFEILEKMPKVLSHYDFHCLIRSRERFYLLRCKRSQLYNTRIDGGTHKYYESERTDRLVGYNYDPYSPD